MKKATNVLGSALACVIALFFLFSSVGELREKWSNSKSLGRFVLSVFGVSSGAPSSGYSEYLASYEQSSKALGASGKLWVRRDLFHIPQPRSSLECLQLKAITERLDANTQRFAAVCKQAKQHERDWSKSKADRFRMEVAAFRYRVMSHWSRYNDGNSPRLRMRRRAGRAGLSRSLISSGWRQNTSKKSNVNSRRFSRRCAVFSKTPRAMWLLRSKRRISS